MKSTLFSYIHTYTLLNVFVNFRSQNTNTLLFEQMIVCRDEPTENNKNITREFSSTASPVVVLSTEKRRYIT